MVRGRKADEAASATMKDHRRRRFRPPATASKCSSSFWLALFLLLCCALFSAVAFSSFRLFGVSFRPVLLSTWQTPAMSAVSTDLPFSHSTTSPSRQILNAISFPDQVVLFLNSPNRNSDLQCLYYPPSSAHPNLQLPPIATLANAPIVRCPLAARGFSVSLTLSPFPAILPLNWDHLAYSAVLVPHDNSTVVFAKGLNLRPARLSDPSRYQCVFGWDFSKPKFLLTSVAVSTAQEIIRCKTPLSVLSLRLDRHWNRSPPMVSVKSLGRGGITLPSVARPELLLPSSRGRKKHTMCICTMVRNQARFLREWIAYHARIGVERWFIYDNNSDDDIGDVVELIRSKAVNYDVSLHEWPWVKTQEAGFAHCALRARDSCKWVGFVDVDEFLYLLTNVTLHDVLRNYSSQPQIGELRTACHSFGPSGRKTIPSEGVMVGYTCRMVAPERHKSIIRPEALNPSLINVVHHFHLREGMRYVNMERGVMVINHYKYQVWEVFKEKFYRRVATYVADWQDEENVGSKDRAPGLGTKAVEPRDWPSRFCEVNDTGLRDWVLQVFVDPNSGRLPW